MNYKVIAKEWRSARHTVGFVAYATGNPANPGEWNSVVGYRDENWYMHAGDDDRNPAFVAEDFDAQYIAANGAKIEWQVAKVLFPYLDITKHKYYTGEK
jgi:hypothetical protein